MVFTSRGPSGTVFAGETSEYRFILDQHNTLPMKKRREESYKACKNESNESPPPCSRPPSSGGLARLEANKACRLDFCFDFLSLFGFVVVVVVVVSEEEVAAAENTEDEEASITGTGGVGVDFGPTRSFAFAKTELGVPDERATVGVGTRLRVMLLSTDALKGRSESVSALMNPCVLFCRFLTAGNSRLGTGDTDVSDTASVPHTKQEVWMQVLLSSRRRASVPSPFPARTLFLFLTVRNDPVQPGTILIRHPLQLIPSSESRTKASTSEANDIAFELAAAERELETP